MIDWFRQFRDIPGVIYEPPSTVDRNRLPERGATPEIHVYEIDGKHQEFLSWPGAGSRSPAGGRVSRDTKMESSPHLLKNVYEGLELPGQPEDYHFLIQGCAMELWSRRRKDAGVLEDVEKLCWLDMQLIEARPDSVTHESGDEPKFYSVPSFSILISLYEREGYLHEALDVAERAARYVHGVEDRDRLVERIAAVENEERE